MLIQVAEKPVPILRMVEVMFPAETVLQMEAKVLRMVGVITIFLVETVLQVEAKILCMVQVIFLTEAVLQVEAKVLCSIFSAEPILQVRMVEIMFPEEAVLQTEVNRQLDISRALGL